MNIYLKALFMITKCSFIYIIQLLRSVRQIEDLEEISFVDSCSCETFQPSLQRLTIYIYVVASRKFMLCHVLIKLLIYMIYTGIFDFTNFYVYNISRASERNLKQFFSVGILFILIFHIINGATVAVVTLLPPTSEAGVQSRHSFKWESW